MNSHASSWAARVLNKIIAVDQPIIVFMIYVVHHLKPYNNTRPWFTNPHSLLLHPLGRAAGARLYDCHWQVAISSFAIGTIYSSAGHAPYNLLRALQRRAAAHDTLDG